MKLGGRFTFLAAGLFSLALAGAQTATVSPVILVERPDVIERFSVNSVMARDMLDQALLKLTSAPDLGTAWSRLGITPADTVGIKITTAGGPLMSSHPALVEAIIAGLREAGLPLEQIIVWDKYENQMIRANYRPGPADEAHPVIASVIPETGFDPTQVYRNEIVGQLIWGDYEFSSRSNQDLVSIAQDSINKVPGYVDPSATGGAPPPQSSNDSHFAQLVSRLCTKIINVPVLTDNSYIGLNGCLGSLALAAVDNNRRFQGDPSYGDPAICEIWQKDVLRRKVVIHIMDALVAQCAGGPGFDPQFTQQIGALYVSRDPVAIDSLVLPRMEAWRKNARVDPIGHTASHISSAAYYQIGTNDPRRIQLIRLP